MLDESTLSLVIKQQRDIEQLGDYFIGRYRKLIADSGMEGQAMAGELAFKWNTLFDSHNTEAGWEIRTARFTNVTY